MNMPNRTLFLITLLSTLTLVSFGCDETTDEYTCNDAADLGEEDAAALGCDYRAVFRDGQLLPVEQVTDPLPEPPAINKFCWVLTPGGKLVESKTCKLNGRPQKPE